MAEPKLPRFLTIEQVAEELAVGAPTVRMLLKTGELRGIQIGGKGLWRVATKDLEDYIEQAYRVTAEKITAGELVADEEPRPESYRRRYSGRMNHMNVKQSEPKTKTSCASLMLSRFNALTGLSVARNWRTNWQLRTQRQLVLPKWLRKMPQTNLKPKDVHTELLVSQDGELNF
jgi:excisionase family DNA binding protein